jgi:hypothetical protein
VDIIASGVRNKAQFTLSARHEVRPVNGLAPELTREQAATLVAVSTGVRGLGEVAAETGFPAKHPWAMAAYGFGFGLIAGYALFGRR